MDTGIRGRSALVCAASRGLGRGCACSLGRQAVLAACAAPDILINNAGGPPLGDFRKLTHEDWLRALEMNMRAPIERGFGRIINITSGTVKAPMPQFDLSNGAF